MPRQFYPGRSEQFIMMMRKRPHLAGGERQEERLGIGLGRALLRKPENDDFDDRDDYDDDDFGDFDDDWNWQ